MSETKQNPGPEYVLSVAQIGKLPDMASRSPSGTATSRILWFTGFGVLMLAVALRLPLIYQRVATEVPAEVETQIGDQRLLSFSLTAGTVLFFLIYSGIMALFFSLSALLDRQLIPDKARIFGKWSVGPYFLIAILATIPVNVFSVTFNLVQPRDLPGYWIYFILIAAASLTMFYRQWQNVSILKKIIIIMTALGLSLVTAIG